jgi:O-antigen ligase
VSSAELIDARGTARPRRPLAARRVTALDRPGLSVLVAAAGVALLPLVRPGGPANTAPVDLVIGLALAVSIFVAVSSGKKWRFPYAVPMLLFLAGGAIGAIAGPVPGAGITALAQDIVVLAWCWVVVNICRSAGGLRILLRTWAYSSVVWAALLFLGLATSTAALSGQTARGASRTTLTFGDPNVCANYLFISIMVIWASQRPRRWPFRFAAYALLIAALATTGSNSGIVSIIVGVAVAALLGVYRRSGVVPAVTMLLFLLLGGYVVAANVNFTSIQEQAQESRYAFIRDGIGREQTSVSQRGSILSESIRLYYAGGALGAGPVSTKTRLQAEQAPFVKEAHDDYAAALAERGVLGLLGVALLVGTIAGRALSGLRPLASQHASAVVRPNALVGAIAGTLITMTVLELLHVRHVWTLFAFVAALSLQGRERR